MSLIPQSAHTKQASCQYLPPPAWNRVGWKCEGECFLGDDLHCLPDDFLWTIWANHLLLAGLHRLVFFGTHLNNTRNASIHVSLFIPNPNPKLWMTLTLASYLCNCSHWSCYYPFSLSPPVLIENEYPTDHDSSNKYFLISWDLWCLESKFPWSQPRPPALTQHTATPDPRYSLNRFKTKLTTESYICEIKLNIKIPSGEHSNKSINLTAALITCKYLGYKLHQEARWLEILLMLFWIFHCGVHYDYQACIWSLRNYDTEVYDMEICINMIGTVVRLDHKMYLIWLKIMVKHSFPVGHGLALRRILVNCSWSRRC